MSKSMTEPSPRDKSARSTARSGSNKRSASADTKKAAAAAQDSAAAAASGGAHGNNSSDGTAGAAAAVHANGGSKPVARSGIISVEVIVLGVRLSFKKKD